METLRQMIYSALIKIKVLQAAVSGISGKENVSNKATNFSTVNNTLYPSVQAVDTAISDAIDALLDGAPGALDTLNELAAALGDDAAFATSVTNALALKMPSASILRAVKTADTTRANTTTRAADPHLAFAAVEAGTYILRAVLHIGVDTGGMSFDWQGTATVSSFFAHIHRELVDGTFPVGVRKSSATNAYDESGAGDMIIEINGSVTFSSAGTFSLFWAQRVSNAVGSIMVSGSSIVLTKI